MASRIFIISDCISGIVKEQFFSRFDTQETIEMVLCEPQSTKLILYTQNLLTEIDYEGFINGMKQEDMVCYLIDRNTYANRIEQKGLTKLLEQKGILTFSMVYHDALHYVNYYKLSRNTVCFYGKEALKDKVIGRVMEFFWQVYRSGSIAVELSDMRSMIAEDTCNYVLPFRDFESTRFQMAKAIYEKLQGRYPRKVLFTLGSTAELGELNGVSDLLTFLYPEASVLFHIAPEEKKFVQLTFSEMIQDVTIEKYNQQRLRIVFEDKKNFQTIYERHLQGAD